MYVWHNGYKSLGAVMMETPIYDPATVATEIPNGRGLSATFILGALA